MSMCKAGHNHEQLKQSPAWGTLPFIGYMDAAEDDLELELRNCACGSTIAIEIPRRIA